METKKWSDWLYVIVLNRAPLAIYTNYKMTREFLIGCLESDVAYGEKRSPRDYVVWRERHNLRYPMEFQRERVCLDLTK